MGISVPSVSDTIQGNLHSKTKRLIEDKVIKELPHVDITFIYTIEIESPVQLQIGQIFTLLHVCNSSVKLQSSTFQTFGSIQKLIKGYVSKETVVLRCWESVAGNLMLTTELKM